MKDVARHRPGWEEMRRVRSFLANLSHRKCMYLNELKMIRSALFFADVNNPFFPFGKTSRNWVVQLFTLKSGYSMIFQWVRIVT